MPLHVFRPFTLGSYECTFVRRNQITIGNITDEDGVTINNVFLNSFVYSPANNNISRKFPIGDTFKYCTFGELKIKISHLTPICINTIGTSATDLAQFQITPYMIGGIMDDGQFGRIRCGGTYQEYVKNNILSTTAPIGVDILRSPKCFTLSAGQIYEYKKRIPNPPGRFFYKTPQNFDSNSIYYLPCDEPVGESSTTEISPFVPKNLYASIPQSPNFPIICIAMQWYDALNDSTNKPRLKASAMLESELQMTFYTDSDSLSYSSRNVGIPLAKTTWTEVNGPNKLRPNFYRE